MPQGFFGLLPGRLTFVVKSNGRIHSIHGNQIRLRTHVEQAREAAESLSNAVPVLVEQR